MRAALGLAAHDVEILQTPAWLATGVFQVVQLDLDACTNACQQPTGGVASLRLHERVARFDAGVGDRHVIAALRLERHAAAELGAAGIRANCIAPGPVDTPMLSDAVYPGLAALVLPTVFVFEGGYAVDEVGVNTVNVLEAFSAA